MTIRVLLADDHAVVREGLAALLRSEPDLEVVGQASNGEEALAGIETLRPDVAVLDVAMARMSGIEVARGVRDSGLRTAVLLLSVHREPSFVRAGLEAGASGYVVKEAVPHELTDAVRAVAAGAGYLSPAITKTVVEELRAGRPTRPPAELAPRERDIVRLLAQGLTSKEIAGRLSLSARTIDSYRAAIMEKLGIFHVPGLVKYAIRNHLAFLDDDAAGAGPLPGRSP